MPALKLTIPGNFWDSQIYMGKLYLWTREGDVITYDWEQLVDSLPDNEYTNLALRCAFARSDYLYRPQLAELFDDRDVGALLAAKFERAALSTYEPSRDSLVAAEVGKQKSPFPFPHTDSTIYKRVMYVGGQQGVFSTACAGRTKHPLSTRSSRVWDGYVAGLSASWLGLAVAAGADGLYEVPSPNSERKKPGIVSPHHASDCDWTYWSIYASSSVSGGYLVDYVKPELDSGPQLRARYLHRERGDRIPVGERTAEEIFGVSSVFSWGLYDKIFSLNSSRISVQRYQPWEKNGERMRKIGDVENGQLSAHGDLISARTATFGVVLEFDDQLVVVGSGEELDVLGPAPINWRVFPRSRRYENQLHVIRQDAIDVLSFNSDYFLNQAQKLLGTRPRLD